MPVPDRGSLPAEQPDPVQFRSSATVNDHRTRGGGRRRRPAPAALLATLLLASGCGPGTGAGAPGLDVRAISSAPAAAAADARRPNAGGGAAEPLPALPRPRTRGDPIASSGSAAFERYLAGPWYRQAAHDGERPHGEPVDIVHFEPDYRRITFFDGEVQEVYSWDASEPRTASRIAVRMHNALVTSVEKTIVAEAAADDEVQLQVWGSDSTDEGEQSGTYRRLGETARSELVRSAAPRPGMARLQLRGRYHGGNGETIVFDAPRFTWQQQGRRWTGGFAVYSVGQLVVVFKIVSMAGTTSEIRAYALEFREHRGSERVRRSLILHPATLEITGVAAGGGTALHFEQVELVDAAGSESGAAGTPATPAADG